MQARLGKMQQTSFIAKTEIENKKMLLDFFDKQARPNQHEPPTFGIISSDKSYEHYMRH